ncbi:Cytochrome P450 94A1 [Apostasia shenzhenica]|uniref:noroxomaritidine synthase n=1 Tax=Apostasia shenzhenica TaxID=1088818 RepID=A0A2I0BGB9_9ASPA|nr:Cytochrome P450 94A1 [Apostasia shenzhenica]
MELEPIETVQKLAGAVVFSAAFTAAAMAGLLALIRWRPWCACPVCRAYVTSSWAEEFPNLGDWYAHLLRSSPRRTIRVHVLGSAVTADPANVKHILQARFDVYPKGAAFSAVLGDLLGRGIFNADGEDWRFQRKLATLELSSPSLRAFASLSLSSILRRRLLPFLRRLPADNLIDLQNVFRRFAFDAICAVSFGIDRIESLPATTALAAAFDAATSLSASRAASPVPIVWRIKRLLNVGSERRLRHSLRLVDLLADHLISDRRRLLATSSSDAIHHDLLSRFMASVDDDRYLRDIVVSLLLAGRDTVAAALTGIFLLLPRHPAVTAAIRREVDFYFPGTGEDSGEIVAGAEELREMHYVHAVVHEGMRLFPPVQFDSKFCAADDVLPDGTFVRKGTRVIYHAYAMGRMEAEWGPDAAEFRPERWLRDGVFSPESPFKYPVFQGGQRMCVGKEMALMEIKAVVVAIVGEFDVELAGGVKTPVFMPGLTATLRDGLPVRVRRRCFGAG